MTSYLAVYYAESEGVEPYESKSDLQVQVELNTFKDTVKNEVIWIKDLKSKFDDNLLKLALKKRTIAQPYNKKERTTFHRLILFKLTKKALLAMINEANDLVAKYLFFLMSERYSEPHLYKIDVSEAEKGLVTAYLAFV